MTTKLFRNRFTSTIAAKQAHMVLDHSDISSFVEFINKHTNHPVVRKELNTSSGPFYDYATKSSAMADIFTGNPRHEKMAQELMQTLAGKTAIAPPRSQVIASPFGSRVVLPLAFAGHPKPYRRRVKTNSDTSPLTVVVNGVSSGGITSTDLHKRGAAFGALLKKLSEFRPVNAYALLSARVNNFTAFHLVKIATAPVSLRRAAHLFADQGVSRLLGFASYYAAEVEYSGTTKSSMVMWPFNNSKYASQDHATGESIVEDLEDYFKTSILYMPGVLGYEANTQAILENPVDWINGIVKANS